MLVVCVVLQVVLACPAGISVIPKAGHFLPLMVSPPPAVNTHPLCPPGVLVLHTEK
jgi:hypothetical protein